MKKMAPKAEACAECTQNCLLMHKKEKNPLPVATTFFKVMFGDEYSKVLFLPPRFAHSVRHMVGKTTRLENSSGEKYEVKFTMVDGLLAFEEGWNEFWEAHGLKVGDFLVFHYVMESHFVVLMYGESGCPEIRHFGFNTQHPVKETKTKHKVTVDDHTPSNMNTTTNGHCSETEHSHSLQKETRIKQQRTDDIVSSVSDKETGQRTEPVVKNTGCETPVVCLDDQEDEESRRNGLLDFSTPENPPGDRKSNVVVGGGGGETKVNESGKILDSRSEKIPEKLMEVPEKSKEMPEKPKETPEKPKRSPEKPKKSPEKAKESTRIPSVTTYTNSIKKRLRNSMLPTTPSKIAKKDSTSKHDTSGSRFQNAAKPIETPKMELKTNQGPIGGTNTGFPNPHKEENNDILLKVKPEPVDYDETPSSVSTNSSFSAVMTTYKYLVLPKWVKLKSKVILLRNKDVLWPVLYQKKVGVNALTQSWEAFARERGIQPGDNCEFVLESEANSNYTCTTFMVHVTRT